MSSGRSGISTCCARAALAGNPSDGYGGAVLAVPIPRLTAIASIEESADVAVRADDVDLHRLLVAAVDEYRSTIGPIDGGTLSATTTIPRSVGLAGSSALVIAALRAIASCNGHQWRTIALAEAALRVERDRLDIAAGLQDRLVQATGVPTAMEFAPIGFRTVDCPVELPLLIAWSGDRAETSDTVHRSLRRRYEAGDPTVRRNLAAIAEQGRAAGLAMEAGDLPRLAAAVNRTFEIRADTIEIDATTLALARSAHRSGAAVNTAGSGGSVVALYPTLARRDAGADTLRRAGYDTIIIR